MLSDDARKLADELKHLGVMRAFDHGITIDSPSETSIASQINALSIGKSDVTVLICDDLAFCVVMIPELTRRGTFGRIIVQSLSIDQTTFEQCAAIQAFEFGFCKLDLSDKDRRRQFRDEYITRFCKEDTKYYPSDFGERAYDAVGLIYQVFEHSSRARTDWRRQFRNQLFSGISCVFRIGDDNVAREVVRLKFHDKTGKVDSILLDK